MDHLMKLASALSPNIEQACLEDDLNQLSAADLAGILKTARLEHTVRRVADKVTSTARKAATTLKDVATAKQFREGAEGVHQGMKSAKNFAGFVPDKALKGIREHAKKLHGENIKSTLMGAAKTTALYGGAAAGAVKGGKALHKKLKKEYPLNAEERGEAAAPTQEKTSAVLEGSIELFKMADAWGRELVKTAIPAGSVARAAGWGQKMVGGAMRAAVSHPMGTRAAVGAAGGAVAGAMTGHGTQVGPNGQVQQGNRLGRAVGGAMIGGALGAGASGIAHEVGSMNNTAGRFARGALGQTSRQSGSIAGVQAARKMETAQRATATAGKATAAVKKSLPATQTAPRGVLQNPAMQGGAPFRGAPVQRPVPQQSASLNSQVDALAAAQKGKKLKPVAANNAGHGTNIQPASNGMQAP